ncbi:unnamed protein product [Nesidiocoris tenuis]|uniref:RNA-binding protein 48 n=1 Tax=Nesidiocoris tenuis TaxID=355587 RepID=A0A6H5HNE4_9HEMI|nr:unnamed protein product [Nesidiocoris tenuis]
MEFKSETVAVHLPHHEQQELCDSRPAYRQGRKLTAVKVYTVNNESQHLLIYRVPAINLENEVMTLCERFGQVTSLRKLVSNHPNDEVFTDIYHVQYGKIRQARAAKRQMDTRSFYGSVLHVCYAPELETVQETRSKLINRRNEIAHYTGRKPRPPHVRRNKK